MPWEVFELSFLEDVEHYLSLLGGENLLDEDAPDKPCKPSTIKTRRDYLRLAASAAVKQGVPAESLRSLADLVSPPVVRRILELYVAKKGGKISTFTIDMAERLYAIARTYAKAPEEQLRQLERFCIKLRPNRRPGLTEKNMAVVRAFKDPQNRARLKALPTQLFNEALAERDARMQGAVTAELAVLIQILLVAPMRLANLAALHLETSVIRIGGPEPTYHLVIPLKPRTLEDLTRRYAYFLSFLVGGGKLTQHGPAAASVTEENILLYVRYLEPRVSSVTLAQSLYKIARVAACLDPERDWRWLQRVARRLDLRAKPRDKRHEVVEIKQLFQLGLRLMNDAEKSENSASLGRAELYRDGLVIALLSADPLRLANITALEIARTLVKDGATWSVEIPAEETKERRLHLAVLPNWCGPCLDRYIHHYLPVFPNAESTSRLWLTRSGRLLGENALYRLICKRTRAAFDKRINPHLFRSCLATSTAVHHGAQMGLAITVLRHRNSEDIELHYNQAKMIDAVRAYQEMLLGDA